MPARNAKTTRHWARRPFKYAGVDMDRGQVFELIGAINDEKLVRLGYCDELDPKTELHTCAECGAEFIGIGERTGHGAKRHDPFAPDPERDPAGYDRMVERELRQLEQVAPLNTGG